MADETDALYQAPLADFVRVRDEIAARRKAAGDKAGAAAVRALRKPSVPAWAANQVVWRAPAEWERLLAAGAALRRGHETGAPPEELRQASREQREAISACEARAAAFLTTHGHAATPAVLQKTGATLQALVHGSSDATPGRVLEERSPPGFDALAGLSLAAPPPPDAPVSAPAGSREAEPASSSAEEERVREETRRANRAAARDRDAAARAALAAARASVAERESRRAELERALGEATAEEAVARRALAAAEEEAAAAALGLETPLAASDEVEG